jgi:hypothetical protein
MYVYFVLCSNVFGYFLVGIPDIYLWGIYDITALDSSNSKICI